MHNYLSCLIYNCWYQDTFIFVKVDGILVPFSAYGPKHTPPIRNYETQDGEYVDETPTWK